VQIIVDAYDRHILEPGKAPLFWMVAAFIVTFAFIRFSVHMIRRQVRWWPGNIDAGGVHVHHLVFGIFMMLAAGILEFGADPDGAGTVLLPMLFGCGAALTMDEYALWLHLEDVYWAQEGRQSIDAVILVGLFMMLMFMGISPLGVDDLHDQSRSGLAIASGLIAINVVLTSVTLLKGKLATGVVGAFFLPVSLFGAVRLAKPDSPWAHRRYALRPARRARAERRFSEDRARMGRVKGWVVDHLSGQR
jgi:lysyl-tRNA synthetase class 2